MKQPNSRPARSETGSQPTVCPEADVAMRDVIPASIAESGTEHPTDALGRLSGPIRPS
jgi:hypothetical protein